MKRPVSLIVNGEPREVLVEPRCTLLTLLREDLGLTGAKRGCEEGECGACAVLLNGQLTHACLVLAVEAQGAQVVTVEGLGDPRMLSPLQAAFEAAGASQCGYCIPGMLIAATSLLERHPLPTEPEIRQGISGNLCRCTGYDRIVAAIAQAARARHGGR